MLITLIFIFVVGIILIPITNIMSKRKVSYNIIDKTENASIAMIVIGGLFSIIFLLVILLTQTVGTVDKRIELEEKYNAIQYIMSENDFKSGDIRIRNQIYTDIAEYNAEIKVNKRYRNSLWTSWLTSRAYDEFEPIEYDGE